MKKASLNKRIYILSIFLLLGFSTIWLIPKAPDRKMSRLQKTLEMEYGSYKILAKDTEFERVSYRDMNKPKDPEYELSIVFSGRDLNNSIHRPERCLRSQGWNFLKEEKLDLEGILDGGNDVPFRQIVCSKPVVLDSGQTVEIQQVQYYTFVGYKSITEGHIERTILDMKDRVLFGFDQQWAYVTFSMPVTATYQEIEGYEGTIYDLKESEELLQGFMRKLIPEIINN